MDSASLVQKLEKPPEQSPDHCRTRYPADQTESIEPSLPHPLLAGFLTLKRDQSKYLLLFLLFVYLATSERLVAVFIYPVVILYMVGIWILKFVKPRGMNLRNLAIVTVPFVLGIIMELYSRLATAESRFFDNFSWFAEHQIDDPFRLLVFISNNIGIPLMLMAIFSSIWLISRSSRPGLLIAVSALVPLLFLVALNPFVFTKDRYVFPTLYSWILLTVAAVLEIASSLKGNHKWLILGIFLVFLVHAANELVLYYQVNQGNRLPWKSAFQLIQERGEKEDAVVAFCKNWFNRRSTPIKEGCRA